MREFVLHTGENPHSTEVLREKDDVPLDAETLKDDLQRARAPSIVEAAPETQTANVVLAPTEPAVSVEAEPDANTDADADADAQPEPVANEAPAPRVEAPTKPHRKGGQRVFLINYQDRFLGVFEAETDLTPQAAFHHVAQQLALENEAFDPAGLQLYKPVLMRNAKASKAHPVVRGKLELFEEP